MATQKNASSRFFELDALRGLAALAVVLFHYTHRYHDLFRHEDPLWFTLRRGGYGVNLFFMISGFVIFMNLERCKSALDFVVSRLSRLYPAYWAAVILTAIIANSFDLPKRQSDLDEVLVNLTMLQSFFRFPHVDGVYWTLAVELCFYFAMFLLFCSGQLKRVEHFILLLVALTAFDAFAARELGLRISDGRLRTLLLIKYAPYFGIGILCYRLQYSGSTLYRWALLFFCASVPWFSPSALSASILNILMVIFFCTSRGYLPFLRLRPLVFLGTISYPLYLVHQNIGYVIIRALEKAEVNSNIAVLTALASALLLATTLTFIVEQPAMRYLRNLYRGWKEQERFTLKGSFGRKDPVSLGQLVADARPLE